MLYTSQDLLFVILAFCALWLTILLSWSLYYVALLLRGVHQTFEGARQRLQAVDRFLKLVSEKLEHTSASLRILVEGVGSLVGYLIERKTAKGSARRKPRD
ncbi:MAG: hypothetical protein WC052_02215 [Patescibacteria group bacterium]